MVFYDYLLLIVSVLLVIIIVLQGSKDDVSKAFSGEKSELFANRKQRGAEKFVNIAPAVLSIVFFVLAAIASFVPRI